ncbi:hypothetical protein DL95DRAFT_79276 [Leptodontidium sp. 2 PMI_412]|nr:hypothetical protein DL95DRAFT_79276 [Leptodontidium sp. 2 PMI_412]
MWCIFPLLPQSRRPCCSPNLLVDVVQFLLTSTSASTLRHHLHNKRPARRQTTSLRRFLGSDRFPCSSFSSISYVPSFLFSAEC